MDKSLYNIVPMYLNDHLANSSLTRCNFNNLFLLLVFLAWYLIAKWSLKCSHTLFINTLYAIFIALFLMVHSILFTFLPIILDALHSSDNNLSDWVFVSFKLIIELYVSNGIITISKIFIAGKVIGWHLNFAKRWSRPLAFLYACSKFHQGLNFYLVDYQGICMLWHYSWCYHYIWLKYTLMSYINALPFRRP